jgi:Putative redox-active protein (C_GCAxxG_C_C)
MSVVDDSFDQPLKLEEHAVMPLAGGIMMQGYQCGMLWGAALAAGAQAYRLWGSGPQAEMGAVLATQKAVEAFRAHTGEINCAEIIGLNWKTPSKGRILKFFLKGGPLGCFRLAANYAPIAYDEIDTALSDNPIEPPNPPVSCAAVLAQKMGASELHTVMAAGLAGGIGLSGGACGALGAAIWLIGVMSSAAGDGKLSFNDPTASAAIEKFLESSDDEFECAKIVGRKFENAADHAAYVRAGGCAKIIAALAASLPTDRAITPTESGARS